MVPLQPDSVEAEHICRCTGELSDWYFELRAFVLGLGDDITVFTHASRRCTTFRRGHGFAYFNCQPRLHRIAIDIPHPGGDVQFDGDFLLSWSGQRKDRAVRLVVDGADDVKRAKPYLERSYSDCD